MFSVKLNHVNNFFKQVSKGKNFGNIFLDLEFFPPARKFSFEIPGHALENSFVLKLFSHTRESSNLKYFIEIPQI